MRKTVQRVHQGSHRPGQILPTATSYGDQIHHGQVNANGQRQRNGPSSGNRGTIKERQTLFRPGNVAR